VTSSTRRDEIAQLDWKEIDLGRGAIALPASKMKNRRPHVLHLGPTAVAILQACDRGERPLVFGTGHGGFSGWSQSKARLDAKLELEPWVIHDLRRATATHMNEIGVAPHKSTRAWCEHRPSRPDLQGSRPAHSG
jgi:integrase